MVLNRRNTRHCRWSNSIVNTTATSYKKNKDNPYKKNKNQVKLFILPSGAGHHNAILYLVFI
jgi:hypothetical protein